MGSGQPLIVKAFWKEICCICKQKTTTKPLLIESEDSYTDRTHGLTEPLEDHLKDRLSLHVCFSCFVSPDEEHEWDENGDFRNLRHRQSIWYSGNWGIQYPLQESLWDIENIVTYLNQTKNEGRHEIRTIKDKENQKMRDFDIHRYGLLKGSLRSLEHQLEDSEYLPIEGVHVLQNSIKQHKRDMTQLEIKFKKYTRTDIPGRDNGDEAFEMLGLP